MRKVKIEKAENLKIRGYEDVIIESRDMVYCQTQNEEAWLRPVKMINVQGYSIWIIAKGDTRKSLDVM